MNTLLVIALILAMGATLFALIRGIVAFLQMTKEQLNSPEGGPRPSSLKQNRMMMYRTLFQAVAVLIVALVPLMTGNGRCAARRGEAEQEQKWEGRREGKLGRMCCG